jgi:hypothetical protein
MQAEDSEIAHLYMTSSDDKVTGRTPFSNVETVMLMFPTMLWLKFMRQDHNYILNNVLAGYKLESTRSKGIIRTMVEGKAGPVSNRFPSWHELVGPNEDLQLTPSDYLLKNCTPSCHMICPEIVQINTPELSKKKQKDRVESLSNLVKALLADLQTLHSTTRMDVTWYSLKKRVMVDHLLAILASETRAYNKSKMKAGVMLPYVWRVAAHFRAIFELIGFWDPTKYEEIIGHSTIISQIFLAKSGHSDCKIYEVTPFNELNESIFNKLSDTEKTSLKKMKDTDLTNTFSDATDLKNELSAIYIKDPKDPSGPVDAFVNAVQSLVSKRCPNRKRTSSLVKWHTHLTDDEKENDRHAYNFSTESSESPSNASSEETN